MDFAQENVQSMGDSIDHLITTDMKWFSTQQGFDRIYKECRDIAGGSCCLKSAEEIRKRVTAESTVVICTGFCLPPSFPNGENDGLYGSVSMAYAIHHGIGAKVILLAEKEVHKGLEACCIAAGLPVYFDEADFNLVPSSITIREFTKDAGAAPDLAKSFLKKVKPPVMVSIEKMGRNKKDVYHSARGTDMSRYVDKTDYLMEAAQQAGVFTVGIGDLGNEIGMGSVPASVKALIGDLADKCNCPCGGGIVTKVGADVPIISLVANWGGYGIAACLGALLEKPHIFHAADIERRMAEDSTRAGVRDGVSVSTMLMSDGVSLEANIGINHLMREIVRTKTVQLTPFRIWIRNKSPTVGKAGGLGCSSGGG
jgi:hypothetical protein